MKEKELPPKKEELKPVKFYYCLHTWHEDFTKPTGGEYLDNEEVVCTPTPDFRILLEQVWAYQDFVELVRDRCVE